MDELYSAVRQRNVLHKAWQKVKRNAESSSLKKNREEAREFDKNFILNLERIYRKLLRRNFAFEPAAGVLKERGDGRSPRPIVASPIESRIVQRAILDVLQDRVEYVREVLATKTSVGGIPGRGVRDALAIINNAFKQGATHFVRSDIKDFFQCIDRNRVLQILSTHIDDNDFMNLLTNAMKTDLANEHELGRYKELFPLNEDGVAQGSPLSPLIGNILLKEFDEQMNDRGIICIRFIDDFLLLGRGLISVGRAFEFWSSHPE